MNAAGSLERKLSILCTMTSHSDLPSCVTTAADVFTLSVPDSTPRYKVENPIEDGSRDNLIRNGWPSVAVGSPKAGTSIVGTLSNSAPYRNENSLL